MDTDNTVLSSERRAAIVAALNKAIETFIVFNGTSFAEVMADGVSPIANAAGWIASPFTASEIKMASGIWGRFTAGTG